VQVWGHDVVLVDDSNVVCKMDGLPGNEGWLSVAEQIRGREVVSSEGTRIGTLDDVVLDPKGHLVAYELGRRHYSYATLEKRLVALLGEHFGDRVRLDCLV
jgi:uncharacterized protein YrrD